jgi:iron-sulfur cluster assembly protein
MPLEMTDQAVTAIRRFAQKESAPPEAFRVSVEGGGCSGMSYKVLFDKIQSQDHVFEKDGVKLVCDLKSYLFLNGTVLDWKENLMGAAFVFNNPNVTKSCSCGTSFSV